MGRWSLLKIMNVESILFVTLWRGCAKQTIFVCFGAKPKTWNWDLGQDRKWGRKGRSEKEETASWKKEPTGGSWRQARQKGSWQSTPDSRRDQSAWDRVLKQVREDQSRWVGIFSSFVEISRRMHVSVSLHMQRNAECHNLTFLHLS